MIKAKVTKGGANYDFDESSEYRDAYTNLNKSELVQKSKIFNEKKLKESECTDLLNKVIYLFNQVSATYAFISFLSLVRGKTSLTRKKLHVLQRHKAFPVCACSASVPPQTHLCHDKGKFNSI